MSKELFVNTEQSEMDRARSFFVDPTIPASADDLIRLGADSIRVMAQIYATQGNVEQMDSEVRRWLVEDMAGCELSRVVGRLLMHETSTRRFDNKFMGQIHPQGNKVGVLAHLIAAYMNTNTIVEEVSMAENRMEQEVLEWFADIFGYNSDNFSGNVVTGGTTANLTALWVAREKTVMKLKKQGKWDRSRKMVILASGMAHYSVAKSADLLGPSVIYAKTPRSGFKTDVVGMNKSAQAIRKAGNEVVAIVGLAGETETGMVDDLNGLADIAEEYGIHFHVDAAYGGPFVLSKAGDLFDGISRASSITVDPHKMLFVPYSSAAVLFRDKREQMLVEKSMRRKARYLLDGNEMNHADSGVRNYGMSRVEGSMGSAGVIATWATIQLLGKNGISALLNHSIELTTHAYNRVCESGILRPLHVPETNTLLIGLQGNILAGSDHDRLVEKVRDQLDEDGYYISCNGGIDAGRSAFRFVAMHPHTTTKNVDGLFEALEKETLSCLDKT